MIPVLEVQHLHQIFEAGTVNENHVLRGINLTINPGDFMTIIGGNGAGKSTLLNSIAGTIPVEQGTITLNGENAILSHVVRKPSVGSSKIPKWAQPSA